MIEHLNYSSVLAGFTISFAICLLIVATKMGRNGMGVDHTEGIQKFHRVPTPRIGGVGLMAGFLVTWWLLKGEAKEITGWMVFSGFLVFIFGLAEDFSNRVSPGVRLLATLMAGVVFCLVSGVSVTNVSLWWLDHFLESPYFAIAFTAFALATASNAINIIDGFHGLASGTILIMLVAIAIVTMKVGDTALLAVILSLAAVTVGFFIVNFPFGKIFLGDGGAYFLGFTIAAITVLMPARTPELTPWICLLILSYPLTEVLVSVVRKTWTKQHHPGRPDNLHLHMLVYRLVSRKMNTSKGGNIINHVITSMILWLFPFVSLLLTTISNFDSQFVIRSIFAVFFAYLAIYRIAHYFDRTYHS